MKITCLMSSHAKPVYCQQAIRSVVKQTWENWELVVMDSGVLLSTGEFDDFRGDSRIHIEPTGETEELRAVTAMSAWSFNEAFRRGLVHGDIILYLCDDDICYRERFGLFAQYAESHPDVDAMLASAVRTAWNGKRYKELERVDPPDAMGLCVEPPRCFLDEKFDYLQFAHTRRIYDRLPAKWPENKGTDSFAEAVFMDRIGALTPFVPVVGVAGENRITPVSMNRRPEAALSKRHKRTMRADAAKAKGRAAK